MQEAVSHSIPRAFFWRRIHSLLGLWLVLYLTEHLLVNSQAALWIGDDGHGFVRLVNALESLPYLQVLETVLIGIPLLLHGIWGVKRALQAKENSGQSDGSKPSLGEYSRNRAFSWQRITSWVLLFGIIGHVVQMRWLNYPKEAFLSNQHFFMVRINMDEGLYTLADRVGVTLYSKEQIAAMQSSCRNNKLSRTAMSLESSALDLQKEKELQSKQLSYQENEWIQTLSSFCLKPDQVVAVAETPGTAMLLTLRDTFKSPLMAILYTIFVLAAAFHAFNGFWTFLITWGIILSYPSQKTMTKVALAGMLLLSFFGLAAIWGSYWINLRF